MFRLYLRIFILLQVLNYMQGRKNIQEKSFPSPIPRSMQIKMKGCRLFLQKLLYWFMICAGATNHIELLPQDPPFLQCGGGLCDNRVLEGHHRFTQAEGRKHENTNVIPKETYCELSAWIPCSVYCDHHDM